ncbi:MAG: hypothetical protein DRP46_12425 [Candidatus Zixiibacteriota bacterium]|nr:MAG: hypothetical protein DRP46_12425 [candidate division Zixibacteria bacterium]
MKKKIKQLLNWIQREFIYVSWHKYWKGAYIHFIGGKYCYRMFLWGWDKHPKPRKAFWEGQQTAGRL